MLRIETLRAGYHGSTVLHDIHLQVAQPSVHVLIGPNGAGKTTLLHAIAGLVRPSSGRIQLNNLELAGRSAQHIARAGIALVPQGRRVWDSLTVHDHLRISRQRRARRTTVAAQTEWTTSQLLTWFPELAARLNQRAGLLSGGEQQMLAIARALLTQPRLLLLDEPTEGLAPRLVTQILDVITALPATGVIVLAAVPQVEIATRIADRVSVIGAGRISTEPTSPQIRTRPTALQEHLAPAPPP